MADTLVVQDGSRQITFEGEMIASVTSRHHSQPRWSEYRLYKTLSGTYVLEKVGRSVVLHMPGCTEIRESLNRFQEDYPGEDPSSSDWWFCEQCATGGRANMTALLVEQNRTWVMTTDDPAEVIDGLYRRKNRTRQLPVISLNLLEQAARVDKPIADAFRVEHLG